MRGLKWTKESLTVDQIFTFTVNKEIFAIEKHLQSLFDLIAM